MVFQSMLPVSVGLAFTPWEFSHAATAAGVAALTGGLLTLVTLACEQPLPTPQICCWGALYVGTIFYIVALG